MLEFLITSETRRKLLVLLSQGRRGSVAELARATGMNYSISHRELKAMATAGLVETTVDGAQRVHAMRTDSPWGTLVKQMVELSKMPVHHTEPTEADEEVRAQLAAAGAPLLSDPAPAVKAPLAETLAKGAALARRDATVARALPVCLWRNRDQLELASLEKAARQAGSRHSLGFFLDLTAKLAPTGRHRLHEYAEELRDRRVSTTSDFFEGPHSAYGQTLAARRTPDVAKRWHYRMNMDLETFASTFRKFTSREELQSE